MQSASSQGYGKRKAADHYFKQKKKTVNQEDIANDLKQMRLSIADEPPATPSSPRRQAAMHVQANANRVFTYESDAYSAMGPRGVATPTMTKSANMGASPTPTSTKRKGTIGQGARKKAAGHYLQGGRSSPNKTSPTAKRSPGGTGGSPNNANRGTRSPFKQAVGEPYVAGNAAATRKIIEQ